MEGTNGNSRMDRVERALEALTNSDLKLSDGLQSLAGSMANLADIVTGAVLWDWMNGVPVEKIEKRYTISLFQGKLSHGDFRKFADSTRWCIRSVHEIVALMFPDKAPQLTEIELVARSLEIGLPRDALDLLSTPVTLARGEYLALWTAGIMTLDQVKQAGLEQIEKLLGKVRAREIFRGLLGN
jgi:ATP-dependent DNA helicase